MTEFERLNTDICSNWTPKTAGRFIIMGRDEGSTHGWFELPGPKIFRIHTNQGVAALHRSREASLGENKDGDGTSWQRAERVSASNPFCTKDTRPYYQFRGICSTLPVTKTRICQQRLLWLIWSGTNQLLNSFWESNGRFLTDVMTQKCKDAITIQVHQSRLLQLTAHPIGMTSWFNLNLFQSWINK